MRSDCEATFSRLWKINESKSYHKQDRRRLVRLLEALLYLNVSKNEKIFAKCLNFWRSEGKKEEFRYIPDVYVWMEMIQNEKFTYKIVNLTWHDADSSCSSFLPGNFMSLKSYKLLLYCIVYPNSIHNNIFIPYYLFIFERCKQFYLWYKAQ